MGTRYELCLEMHCALITAAGAEARVIISKALWKHIESLYNVICAIQERISDSYIAHVSTLQGPRGAPTLPDYARLPISTLTAFKEFLPDTWVDSGMCRLMSCQRTLVPQRDLNPGP